MEDMTERHWLTTCKKKELQRSAKKFETWLNLQGNSWRLPFSVKINPLVVGTAGQKHYE